MNETKMVNVRLSTELRNQLKREAELDSRTVTGLITMVLKNWLDAKREEAESDAA